MASETVSPPPEGQTVTGLVSGIAHDAQDLMKQQMALFRAEIKADVRHVTAATALIAVGAVAAVPALIFLCDVLVDLLHEGAGLALWASHGIVGVAFVVLSAVLIGIGIHWFRSFNPLPDQSVEAFKENVRWMTTPK
jgi:hypothetical protein